MNGTQKALWFSGIFSAVLAAVIISSITEARQKLDKAVLDNVRQDSELIHYSDKFDSMELQMREMMSIAIGTNNVVIRMEEQLKTFETTK
tara:strand:- start:398 stop:667 length:270 start_codon:yes stop_codon:yes gene_type:complete